LTLPFARISLKKVSVSLVDLEINVNKAGIATHFSVAVGSLAIACMIAAPNIESYVAEDLIYQTFEKNHESLLAYAEISDVQTFFNVLNKATDQPNEPYQHGTLSAARIRAISTLEDTFKDLISTLFVRTWKAYLSAKDRDERDLLLQAFVEDRLKRSSTEPVAMQLDNITTESPALEDLINTRISAREQRMEKLISRLSNQVNAATQKNGLQTLFPTLVPSKRKNQKAQKPKSPKADAPVKDTNKNKQTNGNNKNNTKRTNIKKKASPRT
jgi:hypothetical protein